MQRRSLALKFIRYLNCELVILALAVAVLALLANSLLAASYIMETREQKVLVSDIESTRQSLSEYSSPSSLQSLLAESEVALAAEQKAFASRISGSELTGELLELAREQGLVLIETSAQPGETRQVGQHTYRALQATVHVVGTGEELQAFLEDLEKGALSGLRIEEITINDIAARSTDDLDGAPENEALGGSSRTLEVLLTVSVYERRVNLD